MDEHPVALATTILSPNNCVTSFTYGVSPQPAQAPENSNNGFLNCEPITVVWLIAAVVSFKEAAYSQFAASSAIAFAVGTAARAFSLAIHIFTQFIHPVQSYGETWILN